MPVSPRAVKSDQSQADWIFLSHPQIAHRAIIRKPKRKLSNTLRYKTGEEPSSSKDKKSLRRDSRTQAALVSRILSHFRVSPGIRASGRSPVFLLERPDLPVNPVLDDQFHLVFAHACTVAETNLHFQQVENRLDCGKIRIG